MTKFQRNISQIGLFILILVGIFLLFQSNVISTQTSNQITKEQNISTSTESFPSEEITESDSTVAIPTSETPKIISSQNNSVDSVSLNTQDQNKKKAFSFSNVEISVDQWTNDIICEIVLHDSNKAYPIIGNSIEINNIISTVASNLNIPESEVKIFLNENLIEALEETLLNQGFAEIKTDSELKDAYRRLYLTQSSLSHLRAVAELHYDNNNRSYQGLCSNDVVLSKFQTIDENGGEPKCLASQKEFVISSILPNKKYYCVATEFMGVVETQPAERSFSCPK